MTPFKVGDIVIRHTNCPDSFMVKGNPYKITHIENGYINVEGSNSSYNVDLFSRIKFKFNVGDIVQSIKMNGNFKRGKVHTMSQNGSHFYFETVHGTQSAFKYQVTDFELVAEVKDANSNNDGCVTTKIRLNDFDVPKIQGMDYSRATCDDSYPIGPSLQNIVDQMVSDNILLPNSNPITPMSDKTFNDYAIEAFMSDAHNREEATNTAKVLCTLDANLELVLNEIMKIKKVIVRDKVALVNAMSDCNIETITRLIEENPAVKEFVERFMENKLIDVIPPKENVSVSIADKFK